MISIMVGKCVNKYSEIQTDITNSTDTQPHASLESTVHYSYSPIEIATLVCFMVGIIQVKLNLFVLTTSVILNMNYFAAFDVQFSTWCSIIFAVGMFSKRFHDRSCFSCIHITSQRFAWFTTPSAERKLQTYQSNSNIYSKRLSLKQFF